ncbi:MAG TPA: CocE/NonD family hydrolase [Streptosporangiaceae bacterium]
MAEAEGSTRQDFFPPTSLEKSVRELGADAVRYLVEYVMLPMRDGARLATVIIRPRAGGRYPAIGIRSPYAETSIHEPFQPMFKAHFENNYVVFVQNERGTEWSEGEFGFLTGTTADAQDTLDWISAQDWSNGKIGLHGCSSTAENQLRLGAIGHPALVACVPMSSGAGIGNVPGVNGAQGCFYRGGIPMIKTWALWHAPFGIRLRPKLPAEADGDELARTFRRYSVSVPDFRLPEYLQALDRSTLEAPSGTVLRRMGAPLTGYETYLAEGPTGPSWESVDLIDARHTGATPSLNINGWMDVGAFETVKLFEFQQHHPEQYLIMAPTSHCKMLDTRPDAKLGDRPVGNSYFPYDDIVISWFDRFLLDQADAWKPMPKVQVFLLGAETWLTGPSWPLPDTEDRMLYLTSSESASTLWGDGALVPDPGAAGTDEFVADPQNPVPSLGGDLAMDSAVCRDQRTVECRADVLVYSTPVLDEPITIAGDVSAHLYISADVEDADVFVKLVDVYPDGTAYNLADSCLRLRYRNGLDKPGKLGPGEIVEVTITGIATANYFGPGHQLRIEVAGSNFPLADRNWHAGERNDLASDGPVAHLTLHHGAGHQSALRIRAYTGEITVNTPMSKAPKTG